MTISDGAAEMRIGILDYPGAQASALHGLGEMFEAANGVAARRNARLARLARLPRLRVSHWRKAGGTIARCAGPGGAIAPGGDPRLDALIAPPRIGGMDPGLDLDAERDWIARRHGEGAIACSICAGAFLLAGAGLLDGRPATTHWALEDGFRAAYPLVRVQTARMIVDDGDVVTAGGLTAWLDLGLRLIERFLSPAVTLDVARTFLIDPRGREQRFYSVFVPRFDHGDAAILKVQRRLQAAGRRRMTLAAMAGIAGLSGRTFLRRFQKATGRNPTAYAQLLRVARAREMLESAPLPFERIAWELGYADPAAFRKLFRRETGLNPGEYRRRFGPARPT